MFKNGVHVVVTHQFGNSNLTILIHVFLHQLKPKPNTHSRGRIFGKTGSKRPVVDVVYLIVEICGIDTTDNTSALASKPFGPTEAKRLLPSLTGHVALTQHG